MPTRENSLASMGRRWIPLFPAFCIRIIRRTFTKTDTVQTVGDPRGTDGKEASDAVVGLLPDALAPEAALECFANSKQTASFPPNFRVNRFTAIINVDEQL